MSRTVWYIETSHIHITRNWTLKPTESRKEHNLGMNKSRGIMAYCVAPHFLGSCFFTYFETLRSGPPPEGCINALSSPSPCSSPWTVVDHDAMLTYCSILLACFLSEYCSASGIKVFGLASPRTSAVFICCHVRVIESPACATVGVSL